MALNAQDAINVGVEEVEDVEQEEVLPQAQRRGRNANANVNANDNIPDPPPPPPRVAPRVLPNQGYASASDQNAYKHLKGFVDSCWGSKQTNVSEDALRLRLFPFSLRGKALDWLERLPNHSITTWDELADKFIAKFFSPSHMVALRDEILAFKKEPMEPLHEIWERFRTMTFYRGINTTNQCIVNQLAGGNFMKLPYNEACDVLDEMADTSSAWQSRANVPQGDPNVIHLHKELHDHGQAIAELTTTMNQLSKAQLQQVQNPRQVNAMEGENMMKRRQRGQQQPQENFDNYDDGGGYSNEGFDDQSEEVQYVNNYQGNRGSQGNQQWRPQGNWGNQQGGNWNYNSNQGDNWGNNNSGNQGSSSSGNDMGRIENMFEQMMKKNHDYDAQLASHNTLIRNLEVQLGQISQSLNTHPKGALPSDTVVNPKGGHNNHVMAVTTRSGRGGDVQSSRGNRVVVDEEELQNDEIPLVVEDVVEQSGSDDVRIEIDEGEEETQEAVNPSREHVIDMPEPVVPKDNEPLPRPPLTYPQRLAKQKGDNQFKKFIEMIKSLTINVPLVEALEQMPGYAKFMKDLVTKMRSM
ncbi:uncharacterized protein [Nicotiana sylvestris]|uniref:uncharacterized protein n=1 Tax=Nicotiana sylvestris TaxID=4096 RepID=UPI00388C3CE3